MVSALVVFLVLLNLYLLGIYLLHRRKLLGPGKAELIGPILMLRTKKANQLMDVVARPKLFWKVFGDVGVVATVLAGVVTLVFMAYNVSRVLARDENVARYAPQPQQLIGIPVINPDIPLYYGVLALAVGLIVHEFAHGVLSRVGDVRVKSSGLLMLIVPIGAFVEPDPEDLEKRTMRVKNRMFAAGPMANLTIALITAFLFSSVFVAALSAPPQAAYVVGVSPDSPAFEAGAVPGAYLLEFDGKAVTNTLSFSAFIAEKKAGETVLVKVFYRGEAATRSVVLADKYAYAAAHDPPNARDEDRGKAFFGVSTFNSTYPGTAREIMMDPLSRGLVGFAAYVQLPLGLPAAFDPLQLFKSPFTDIFRNSFVITGPMSVLPEDVFWISANSLYWIFWINFAVGTFNAIPAGPLDGGQMFKSSVRGFLRGFYKVDRSRMVIEAPTEEGAKAVVIVKGADAETQGRLDKADKVTGLISRVMGAFVLFLLVGIIVGPRLI
ncbi:MAG: site-2 protease family protein [Euryarchaeota archaeon]|nr:site-2 protease family protein [Euryarchaeota archaeon]